MRIPKKGDNITFKDKYSTISRYVLNGDIIHETDEEYIISCKEYPFMNGKEVILKKPKSNMIWFTCINN